MATTLTMRLLLILGVMTTTAALHAGGPLLASAFRTAPSPAVGRWRCAADDSTTGKGFGSKKAGIERVGKSKKSKKQQLAAPAAPAVVGADFDDADLGGRSAAEARGRQMMEQMRQEAGAQPANPFKKKVTGPALTPEELAPMDPTVGVMPEVVSQRMLRRVVPFAGLPVFGGIVTFAGFYYANTQLELDLPPQIVAYATQALLLLSFAGITYGVMSTSWDEDEEGSLLGFENVRPNMAAMQGTDMARMAEAKRDNEEAEAEEAGIAMGKRAAQRMRDPK